jgi:hypothetical protein
MPKRKAKDGSEGETVAPRRSSRGVRSQEKGEENARGASSPPVKKVKKSKATKGVKAEIQKDVEKKDDNEDEQGALVLKPLSLLMSQASGSIISLKSMISTVLVRA